MSGRADGATPLVWTPELVKKFWEWESAQAGTLWFTAQVPDALHRLIVAAMPPRAALLDVGCGEGFMGARLMAGGFSYTAADISEERLARVATLLSSRPGWRGTARLGADGAIPVADASQDGVILFETLEHLLDDQLDREIAELRRVLRPGGRLLITVPNAEDIPSKTVFCPVCAHSFHRVQHQRSYTSASLSAFLEARGFATWFAAAGDLVALQSRPLRNPLRWSAFYLARRAALGLARVTAGITGDPRRWLRTALPGQGDNLVWCGTRT